MTRAIRWPATLAVAISAAVGIAACGGGGSIPGNAVALVGSKPITTAAFNHWMTIAAASTAPPSTKAIPPVPVPPEYSACTAYLRSVEHQPAAPKTRTTLANLKKICAKEYVEDKKTALSFLIPAAWALGESEEIGIKVHPKEVMEVFDKTKKETFHTEAALKEYLERTLYTRADLLLKLEIEKVLPVRVENTLVSRAAKSITKPVIEHYYNSHRSKYEKTEGAGLYILLVSTEAEAKAAKKEIESGQSFASVAKRVSNLHTSQKGGVYLTTESGYLETGLNEAIFPAKKHVNQLIGPVNTADGYYVFEVKKTTPAHQEPLSKASEAIKEKLSLEKAEKDLTSFHTTYGKRWRDKTICRPEYYLSSLCGKKEQ